MKKILLILLIALPFLQSFQCGKSNDYFNPVSPTVKLSTILNNTSENILLGDTLKFKLIVPDTINLISKTDGSINKTTVSTLQNCFFNFTFYSIDTIKSRVNRITDAIAIFVADGSLINNVEVHTSSTIKPFSVTLNIIPKFKGLFYVEFGNQETTIKINNSNMAGLRMNMNVGNKHWYLIDPYNPGFSNSMVQRDNEGYGWYCFRVY